ncbi:hypothetical protein PFAG_04838 [Plasmodium falciparum Santa Lucia]|uniref:Uncharacterized protein n=1 Tax=Plasmodium falciparum Santa Lucia TaxID=478859 RepID=W7FCG9_PLAFA|nr:hypothetical protein PFAG_04838 [Plasmodium falciparum Santa Lucia]
MIFFDFLISLQEINEKYEEERKNVSLRISEQTHKIIKNENIFEDVQRQNEELKEKIEEINKEKELEKQLMEDKIKILKIQKEKENEEYHRIDYEALENIRNINDNLALNNLRNKLKLLQEDYNDLEKEYLYLKKSLSKTSTKKHLITKRIQGKSICNNKISYKI